MRRTDLLRSSAFRLALTFGLLFLSAFLVAAGIVYQLLAADLTDRLDESVKETFALLADSYAKGDLEDLIGAVDSNARLANDQELLVLLADASGTRLAGNLEKAGLTPGFSTIAKGTPGFPATADYRAFSGGVGANILTVAISFSETEELEGILVGGFGWATAIAAGLAVVGGAVLATRVQHRLDRIAVTMDDVSRGRLDARIALTGKGDDIDAMSVQVNGALDRLSALLEGMKQVSTDIAHDLKTPLNRLQLILEAAAEKARTGADVTADLFDADLEGKHIDETFGALLRIAQIESGARKSRFAPLDLRDVVAAVAEIYENVAVDEGKTLVLTLPAAAAMIDGDRDLLVQMLANLVENAIRHAQGGKRIALDLAHDTDTASLSIADDGPGIASDEREKVFRRLYRLDRSRSTPGTGLGLSLARAIADLHGATIELSDNRPGLRVVVRFGGSRAVG